MFQVVPRVNDEKHCQESPRPPPASIRTCTLFTGTRTLLRILGMRKQENGEKILPLGQRHDKWKRDFFLQVLGGPSHLLLLRLLPTSTLLSIPTCQAMGCWDGNGQVGLWPRAYRPVSLIFVIDTARCDQPGHLPPWSVANKWVWQQSWEVWGHCLLWSLSLIPLWQQLNFPVRDLGQLIKHLLAQGLVLADFKASSSLPQKEVRRPDCKAILTLLRDPVNWTFQSAKAQSPL